jgi:NAD(P)-dependent dehydrogenase (short-subunit alcohol dehydrogenase family)
MSRYEKVHQNPQGFGDARPTALQIIKDEGVEGKLQGKVIVITGTSAGIGVETARALKLTGARLLLTARDLNKAATALEGILEPGKVELVELDNASLKSVRKGAAEILARTDNQVNILINNAGIMAPQELILTEDGFETQFGVNHLAHFLLFELLKPALLASSTPSLKSRVVTLSSSAHNVQGINDSDNYNYEKGGYTPFGAYGQSKTANLYFSNEIERRYGGQGLHATAVHPGMVATSLTRHVGDEMSEAIKANPELANLLKNPEQGAATTVWAAIGKEWENRGGAYLADVAEQSRSDGGHELLTVGYAEWIEDAEKQARLWKDSLRLVDLSN